MSKPSLSKTLAFRLMFVSILTIFILGSLWVYSVYSHYEEASRNIRESYIVQQKQKIEGVVKSSKRLINAYIIQAQAADGSSSLSDIKADALEQLFHIQYNDDGYVFAASWDGMSLAGPAKGKSVLDAKDVNGVLVVQELIKLSKSGGGYFTYHIPASTGAKPVEKISYVVGIPEWEWYVGAGFDLLLLEEQVMALQEKSKKERNLVLFIVAAAIVTLTLVIVLSAQVEMRRIKKNYQRFMDFFRSADPENSKIDTASMRFVEFEEIALAANEMIARRLEVEEALQESQVRLAHHLQNTPLGNVSFDRSFHITEWNMAAEKIFGFSADEIIGKHVAGTLLPPDIGEQVNKIWKLLLENRGGIQSTNENLTKDGRTIICAWYNTPILDNNGEVIGVTSLIQDNTERKLLEEKVNQSQKLEAVGQLTGGIAHDFNNLMAVMMGNLELTLEQLEPKAPIRDKIENALRAVERGARLTKQLLSFSRRQVLSPSRIDIQKLVDETVTFLERTLGASIEIKREYTAEEILVDIDGDIFGNALVNLSLNARDAMPDGGVLTFQVSKIMPETRAAELNEGAAPRPYVCIKVSDTGDGMSEDVMEQVFEPFFTTKDVGKGSGLGLSMVYGFVSQSDGHMEITSQEGEGTEISIYFPIPDQD